jgi:serine/threonine protein kinase
LDQAASTWIFLSGRVAEFIRAWETADVPPAISRFLEAEAPGTQRVLAVELIKVDLEYRWLHRGPSRLIEAYLVEIPELAAGLPVDLLYEEYFVRKRAGEDVQLSEYAARFPAEWDELQRLIGNGSAADSLRTVHPRPPGIFGLQPGTQLDDFDLLLRLGEGAFASVFLARQRSMQRLVALKVSANRGNEPQTLAQLDHEAVIRVYDQRVLPDQGVRLMYMQYAAGGTLQAVIEAIQAVPSAERAGRSLVRAIDAALELRGESPPAGSALRTWLAAANWAEIVCFLGAKIAQGLDYAHRHGVLHRDIKPANVLLTGEGMPKIADFNISFNAQAAGAAPAAYFGGSLAYMSPEQLEACNPWHAREPSSLDGRSDLYSLGVLLWELLTGQRPFAAEQVGADWGKTLDQMTARRRQGVDVAALRPLTAKSAPGLDGVLGRCLAAEPDKRFSTGGELARQLELCLCPRTQELLIGESCWRHLVQRWTVPILLVLSVAPNAVAAVFNFSYNRAEIIPVLKGSEALFWKVQIAINSVAFPVGIGLLALLFRAVGRTVRAALKGAPLAPERLQRDRRRALFLGHLSACICLTLWILAAPAYPIAIQAGLGDIPMSIYIHFVGSLTICGLVATVYPFFAVTLVSLRCLYAPLVRLPGTEQDDLRDLRRAERLSSLYFLLAASVPLLSVSLLVLIGSKARFALIILTGGGLLGLGLAFLAWRQLQADLAALAVAISPEPPRQFSASASRPRP